MTGSKLGATWHSNDGSQIFFPRWRTHSMSLVCIVDDRELLFLACQIGFFTWWDVFLHDKQKMKLLLSLRWEHLSLVRKGKGSTMMSHTHFLCLGLSLKIYVAHKVSRRQKKTINIWETLPGNPWFWRWKTILFGIGHVKKLLKTCLELYKIHWTGCGVCPLSLDMP